MTGQPPAGLNKWQRAAWRRRNHYQARIAAGDGVVKQFGAAWMWLLAEVRDWAKARDTRWRAKGRPADDVLAEARDALVKIARDLNEEGAKR